MKKFYLLTLSTIILVLGLGYFTATNVSADPSFFTRVRTETASTTTNFITPGTGTTTLIIGLSNDIDDVDVMIQLYASTSLTVVDIYNQYSNDNIDWYNGATSTIRGNLTASTTRFIVRRPSHMANYQRAVFVVPIGANNATIYAEANAKRNAN